MELNEYQNRAMGTCMLSCDNFAYMFLNLVGEAGELASKAAKLIRKGEARIEDNNICLTGASIGTWEDMLLELGDILWQVAGTAHALGVNLDVVAQRNLDKLASRKQRGVIDGNGDHR